MDGVGACSVVNERTLEARGGGKCLGRVWGHFGNGEEVDKGGPQACKIVR